MTVRKPASTTAPLHPLLAERWSPRGFDPAHALAEHEIVALLEAARWAPSANNSQPWRFLVTLREDDAFDLLLDTLAPGNQAWAHAAAALILVAAQGTDDSGQLRRWAHYDTGQAVAALGLQAEALGLRVHQMGGFDAARARSEFDLDSSVEPLVVVAVGRHDPGADLPDQLAAREDAPRSREPLDSLLLRPLPDPERHVA